MTHHTPRKISNDGGRQTLVAHSAPAHSDSSHPNAPVETFDEKRRRYLRCLEGPLYLNSEINEAGDQAFDSPLLFMEWLCEPAVALGWQVPFDVIRTQEGRRHVADILGVMAQTGRQLIPMPDLQDGASGPFKIFKLGQPVNSPQL